MYAGVSYGTSMRDALLAELGMYTIKAQDNKRIGA